MINENIVLFHIGTCKTGTTSLQHYLFQNREKLKKYGWYYPDLQGIIAMKSDERNAEVFWSGNYKYNMKVDTNTENWKASWKYIAEALKNYNIILSAEGLFDIDIEFMLQEVKKIHKNIKVITYLRRQDLYIESWWNHVIKHWKPNYQHNIDSMVNNKDLEFRWDYLSRLDSISKVIGIENVIVRVYEKQQLRGGEIVEDFFDSVGIRIDPKCAEFESINILNERLEGELLEIKQLANYVLGREKDEKTNQFFYSTFCDMYKLNQANNRYDCQYGYLSEEERKNILLRYQDGNATIAKRYLKRENGELFYDMHIDIPQYTPQSTAFEKDMIFLFSEFISRIFRRLIKQNRILIEQHIKMQKQERKLFFWGAGSNCRRILSYLQLPVEAVIDNNQEKDGKNINGIPIMHVSRIPEWSHIFIVVTNVQTEDIEAQIQEMGLEKWNDYLLAKEYCL